PVWLSETAPADRFISRAMAKGGRLGGQREAPGRDVEMPPRGAGGAGVAHPRTRCPNLHTVSVDRRRSYGRLYFSRREWSCARGSPSSRRALDLLPATCAGARGR